MLPGIYSATKDQDLASLVGRGLAVHIALARFDDHLSFSRLEQRFLERHGVSIPRQHMVQWIKQVALLLRPVYDAMWPQMVMGTYLQIDETPVKVMGPVVSI